MNNIDKLSRYISTVHWALRYSIVPAVTSILITVLMTHIRLETNKDYYCMIAIYYGIVIIDIVIITAEYMICKALKNKKCANVENKKSVVSRILFIVISIIETALMVCIAGVISGLLV